MLKITEYDQYVSDHPELERYFDSAPAVTFNGKTFGSLDSQTDNTWKEVLAKIGEHHPNSKLGQDYRKNKTVKERKTIDIVEKHRQKVRDLNRRGS